jgi:hypothetical protein
LPAKQRSNHYGNMFGASGNLKLGSNIVDLRDWTSQVVSTP